VAPTVAIPWAKSR